MIVGPEGRSKGTDSENPINPARSALMMEIVNVPAMLRASSLPVTAGRTRKLNTSITPANCMANAMTSPRVRYRNRFQNVTR